MKNRLLVLAAWIRTRVSPLSVVVAGLLVMSVAMAVRTRRTEAQLDSLRAKYDGAAAVQVVQVHDAQGHKLGAALVPQRAGDFFVSPTAASPFAIKDGSGVTRDTFETTHGKIQAGNGTSDPSTVIGPYTGGTYAAAWFLGTGSAVGGANYAFLGDGSTLTVLNSATGATTRLTFNGDITSGLALSAPSQTQLLFGTGVSDGRIGTNKAGATLTLAADAAANVEQFAGGTQNGVTLGANLATVGHMRTPNTFLWNARNNANTADVNVLKFSSNDTVRFGDAANGPGAYVELNEPNAGVILGAFGGWTLLWDSSGLLATAGSVNIGTNHASGNTTTIIAGTGQSVIQASAMTAAGTGNTSIIGSMQFTTRTVTSGFTVDTTTTDHTICADTSAGAFTMTLPAPTLGRSLTLVNCGSSGPTSGWAAHNLTVAQHASEKINGTAASKVLTGAGQPVCEFDSTDGVNWFTDCQFLIPLLFARRKRRAMNDNAERARKWLARAA